jgi:hypothetical protein
VGLELGWALPSLVGAVWFLNKVRTLEVSHLHLRDCPRMPQLFILQLVMPASIELDDAVLLYSLWRTLSAKTHN